MNTPAVTARQPRSLLQFSIAGKIFGLAVLLLALTVLLTGFLLWQSSRIRLELEQLAIHEMPLSRAIADVDYAAVQRHRHWWRFACCLPRWWKSTRG